MVRGLFGSFFGKISATDIGELSPKAQAEVMVTESPRINRPNPQFSAPLGNPDSPPLHGGLYSQGAVWCLVILGIVLRLRMYLFDRSLWLDECFLALNIIRRSPAQFLAPLDNNQAAPLGFLLMEKATVHYLGTGEMALRLVPFICGVAAIFLFLAVARRFVQSATVPIAVGLFSICGPLIYYSSELKPYCTDVAVALILYLLAGWLYDEQIGIAQLIGVSVFGACAIWLSFPTLFVLGGVGFSTLWALAKSNNQKTALKVVIPFTVWACSLALYCLSSLHKVSQNQKLKEYWQDAFMPLPPTSSADIRWFVDTLFSIFSNPVGLTLTGIAATAAIIGAWRLRAAHFGRFLLLIIPIALALLASGLHLYPFRGRLLLFIAPALILFIAVGLERIQTQTRGVLPSLGPILLGLLLLQPAIAAGRDFFRPRGFEESRPVIEYIEKHRSAGDLLYIYYPATSVVDYYRQRGLLGPIDQVIGVESRHDWKAYRVDLEKLRGQKRVWIIFSHVWNSTGGDEQRVLLGYLDDLGGRLDEVQATGASAYLYDLSAPPK
jgi:hypothetical protein